MRPILGRVSMIKRIKATDANMRITEAKDPLNYWGLMHLGMAHNMAMGQMKMRNGPTIEMPFIVLSSPNDTHVNSMGSHYLYELSSSKDKTLCWMQGMGHSLLYEPPGCEKVVTLVTDWIHGRSTPNHSQAKNQVDIPKEMDGVTIRTVRP